MPRPTKWRRVSFLPEITLFKPAGVPTRLLEEVCLSVEEAEALRLKDLEGLQQEECAARMRISRPTFHRELASARRKVTDALINGKAIRIEGGNYQMAMRRFRCDDDSHEWDVSFDAMISGHRPQCPRCASINIYPLRPIRLNPGGRRRRQPHRGGRKDGE